MRILLVEDDAMIGKAVLDVLRSEHYATDWVRDGEAAEAALLAERYDLVLLDLGLPRADGLAVLRSLRARRYRPGADRHRPRTPSAIGWPASTPAPTTTSSSPTTPMNCWPACGRCCGAAPAGASR